MRQNEFQRTGRNKLTQINRSYIESGQYRKKFDCISDSKDLNRLIYNLSKKMLIHRTGTEYEDMYWIDLDTLKVVAEETTSKELKQITYSDNTIKIVEAYKRTPNKRLLTIHTHPSSYPPSIPDFNSNFQNEYNIGFVICHDGKIFMYAAEEEISEDYYNLLVAKRMNQGYNNYEARCLSLEQMQENFKMIFKEVMDYDNGK